MQNYSLEKTQGHRISRRNLEDNHSLSAYIQTTDTETYKVYCIHSPDKESSITYLLNKKEPREEKQCMLLVDGSIETNDLDFNSLNDFFQRQIEADKKAFKCGRIRYPIYEMLSTVSKFIKLRKTVYSVNFTGERKVSYQNTCVAEHKIEVNPEKGFFKLDNSDKKYIEYLPEVSVENLLDIREKCYKFADRPNKILASIFDKIEETWKNCEVTVFIDRHEIGVILIGRGEEETHETRQIINYVDGVVTSCPEKTIDIITDL